LDPVLIAVMVACVQGISRLVDALAQWVVLHARGELVKAVAAAPGDVQVCQRDRRGSAWWVQTGSSRGPGHE
jgi:hypothetical protein